MTAIIFVRNSDKNSGKIATMQKECQAKLPKKTQGFLRG